MKYGFVIVLLWAVCLTTMACFAADNFGGVPWPSHVEWSRYDVPNEGWTMCKPTSDSTEVCIPLRPGTQVYIPRLVKGRGEDGDTGSRGRRVDHLPGIN